jgi:hypothetical protein
MKRRNFIQATTTVLFRTGAGSSTTDAAAKKSISPRKKPTICFYHDGRHPLIYMYEPPIQKEEYEAAVDELVGTPIEAIMFGLGDGRTMLHDTKVGEQWGHWVKKWPGPPLYRRVRRSLLQLIKEGNDPLRIVCERAHTHGLMVYPSLFLNQRTGTAETDVRSSEFRFNNRHLEIDAGGGVDPDFPGLRGLDFKHEKVRDERFALIEEVLKNYPERRPGFQLPVALHVNQAVRVEWTVTDDLPHWEKKGRVHEVLLRARLIYATEIDRVEFRLNGKLIPDSLLRKINRLYKMSAPRYRVFGYWFIFKLDPKHWPPKGINTLEVTATHRDPDTTPQLTLRDVEMEIKYLMGKNFHRGQDPDLGRYECSVQ